MPKTAVRLVLAALGGCLLTAWSVAASMPGANPQPLSDPNGSWVLEPALSDEFTGPAVDETKWQILDYNQSWSKTWSWDKKNVSVDAASGHLRLQMAYDPHVGQPGSGQNGEKMNYTSGCLRSKGAQRYGYFECRIQGAANFPGSCPAFWLFQDTHKTKPVHWATELDIVEAQQATTANDPRRLDFTAIFWHGETAPGVALKGSPLDQTAFTPEWDIKDDFHVFGLQWAPEKIIWFVDGKPVKTLDAAATKGVLPSQFVEPMQILCSFGLRRPLDVTPDEKSFPRFCKFDYVRTWQAPASAK